MTREQELIRGIQEYEKDATRIKKEIEDKPSEFPIDARYHFLFCVNQLIQDCYTELAELRGIKYKDVVGGKE